MGRVVGYALLMLVTCCGSDPTGDVGRTALDCRHGDGDVCRLLASISENQDRQNVSADARTKQVEIDVGMMFNGMKHQRPDPEQDKKDSTPDQGRPAVR